VLTNTHFTQKKYKKKNRYGALPVESKYVVGHTDPSNKYPEFKKRQEEKRG